jgi:hypothetical protein
MKNFALEKLDHPSEARIRAIVALSRRRDRLLEEPGLDLDALAALAADYESANMPCSAAELRKRLEWYRLTKPQPGRTGQE